jgi:hypothetical protein
VEKEEDEEEEEKDEEVEDKEEEEGEGGGDDTTGFERLQLSPLNRISSAVADSNLLPLKFLRFPEHCVRLSIIHILGFITPNFLTICLMIMAALAIFHSWI